MKRPRKAMKIIIVTLITIILLLAGTVALASAYPDHPVLQFFVIDNPFTAPQQDIFPIVQLFEENDLTRDRIDNIQFAVLPDGGVITITDPEDIKTIWGVLSEIELTTDSVEEAKINDELAIYVDFHFTALDRNWNWTVGIEAFGPVYVLGRGPFVCIGRSTERIFIDLFDELNRTNMTGKRVYAVWEY